MLAKSSGKGARLPLFLICFVIAAALHAGSTFDPILKNDHIMPSKEVIKIRQMGTELYEKTKIPVFVAAVDDLNRTKPVDILDSIKPHYRTYVLLFVSLHPASVNIFMSDDAKNLADFAQILSPLPWRGTIKPVMSPAFSKDTNVKVEVAILNGYADIVDQIAEAKGVKLSSSIGSGSRSSFLIARWIFYGIIVFLILQYIYYKRKRRV